jgi:hypothetical protein
LMERFLSCDFRDELWRDKAGSGCALDAYWARQAVRNPNVLKH